MLDIAQSRACYVWPLLVALSMSCHDEESILFIYDLGDEATVSSESPLCEGDLAAIERSIVRIEGLLDAEDGDPLEIFLHDRVATLGCSTVLAGCYVDGEIHTLWQAIDHEIVHAIASRLERSSSFWNEGIAVALSGRIRRGRTGVDSNLALSPGDLDYSTAGHFVRWLVEDHGIEGVRKIARGQTFRDSYEMDLEDAITEYESSAPWSYPSWNPCPGTLLTPMAPGHFEASIEINCSEMEDTTQLSLGVATVRTFDIENAGSYRLFIGGGTHVFMVACQLDVVEEPPDSDFLGDIIREDAGAKPPTVFFSDVENEVWLEPGRIQIRFATDEGVEREEIRFELEPLGPSRG